MTAALLLALMQSLPSGPPGDSAEAIRQAHYLVRWHNDRLDARVETRPCQGVSFKECMRGDWGCLRVYCNSSIPRDHAIVMRELERLAPYAGNSAWLFQQRVGHAAMHGDTSRAREIAASCDGEEWWCLQLRGFAQHWTAPGDGLSEFYAAAARMPDPERCRMHDVTSVVPSDLDARAFSQACTFTASGAARFWWLADPLWSRADNERLAEHYARYVMWRVFIGRRVSDPTISTGYVPPQNLTIRPSWDWPLDSVFAVGFPNSRRHRPATYWINDTTLHTWQTAPGFYVQGGYSFVPDGRRFSTPLQSTAADWAVQWDRGAERMITRETWHNLEPQSAVFRRGAQLLVVAAASLPRPLAGSSELQLNLALGRLSDMSTELYPARVDRSRVMRVSALADTAAYLASLEVIGPKDIGRSRYGAPAPHLVNGFGISDFVLVEESFESGQLLLEDALLPSTIISGRRRVGIYFEVYGAAEGDSLEIALTGFRGNISLTGRLAGALGLSARSTPAGLIWREQLPRPDGDVTTRFFVLDIGNIGRGEHRLELTVRRNGGIAATVSRVVYVR